MKNKKILLAVCGSISFYKAFEILSLLKKEGFDVYVMLSDGALNFVNYKSFEALCDHLVLCSETENWQSGLNHINYAKMDCVLIAPASVNTINKLANGICDNVFMQTLIATNAQLIIAPAANNKMIENPSTQKSLKFLNENGAIIIDPVYKTLACKDIGKGALADIEDIIYATKRAVYKDSFFAGKTVVVTGGPTTEKIDDIRGITNFSSGKMAKALADAFYFLGAKVILITSVDHTAPYKITKFKSTIGLQSAILSSKLKDKDILVMAAAVSDYVPKTKIKGKAKKEEIGDIWSLRFGQNIDILSSLRDEKFKKIGFKLETNTQTALNNAKKMLDEKNLDAVCLNVLDEDVTLGSDKTKISFITKKDTVCIDLAPKFDVAMKIAQLCKSL